MNAAHDLWLWYRPPGYVPRHAARRPERRVLREAAVVAAVLVVCATVIGSLWIGRAR